MGLDMFLEKCDARVYAYIDRDLSEIKENSPDLYQDLLPYIHNRGEYYHWESLLEEIGYWRKANQIHKWFVDNVQNGIDDCGYYRVSKEQLEDLLQRCETIKRMVNLEEGKIQNGSQCENGEWKPIMEDGFYITNPEICEELLPTQSGCFFGSTDYDEYYYNDIENTIEILLDVIEKTDWDKEVVVYNSSW